MPRAKKPSKSKMPKAPQGKYAAASEGEVEWGGYVNVAVDDDTKLIYEAWLVGEGANFWGHLEDAMGEGLKFGLSYDADSACFLASLTGCGVLVSRSRFCLTARSPRFEDATALLMFKHLVMAQGDWGNYRPRTRGFDSWG